MKRYRLKPEAVPFFKEGIANSIYDMETWKKLQVDLKALEEVEECFITYGHRNKDDSGAICCGWNEKGSHFHFTLNFPSMKYREHDAFSNGKMIRELMDDIQRCVNRFYDQFNDK